MILHLTGDVIFTRMAIDYFNEASDEKNVFLVDIDVGSTVKQVNMNSSDVLPYKRGNSWVDQFIMMNIKEISQVFVHNLSYYRAHLINKYLGGKHVTWIFYGADVYESFNELTGELVQEQTKNITSKGYFLKKKVRNSLRPLFFKIRSPWKQWNFSKRDAISKINVFANADRAGFDLISQKLKFEMEWRWFTFYDVKSQIKEIELPSTLKNQVLVGNSANPFNNHLDIFNRLKDEGLHLGIEKIIVPLSYGDQKYARKIRNIGEDFFGAGFNPLMEFLDKKAYHQMLVSCRAIIMNHLRPQATGNINMALCNGVMIYLNEKNPLYAYYTRLGIKIFSIEQDLQLLASDYELAEPVKKENRRIIEEVYNRQKILDAISEMVI